MKGDLLPDSFEGETGAVLREMARLGWTWRLGKMNIEHKSVEGSTLNYNITAPLEVFYLGRPATPDECRAAMREAYKAIGRPYETAKASRKDIQNT